MNARQKAKYYKKLYENCRIPVNRFYITQDTLKAYRIAVGFDMYQIQALNRYSDDMTDWKIKKLAYYIASQLEKELPNLMDINSTTDRAVFEFWVKRKNEVTV